MYEEASHIFRQLFEKAVKIRLRADVPVGYCLSGGLDSSAIVCMADKLIRETRESVEQHAISSCSEDKRYDEQEYIDEVICHSDIKSHKVFSKFENLFESIDNIIWHMDEPFGSTSIYTQWNVFREAKNNGLTVMLDGQGADEQLAGYTGFYSVAFAEHIRRFKFVELYREFKAYKNLRVNTENHVDSKKIIVNAFLSAFVPAKWTEYLKLKLYYQKQQLPFSKEQINEVSENLRIYSANRSRLYILEQIQQRMPSLLHFEDRNSMANSIESRVPFLDYHLVETVFSMPMEYKIRKGITKSVMRDGLRDVLPEKILSRYSKLGFETPEDQWINDNQDLFRKELELACESLQPLLEKQQVMKWYDECGRNATRGNYLLWRIICAGRWMNVFNVSLCP